MCIGVKKITQENKNTRIKTRLPHRGVVYLRVVNNEVNTLNKGYMSTMHSYTLLESIVYELQSKGAIVDPCVVDDLITCITTTKKVEYNKIKL